MTDCIAYIYDYLIIELQLKRCGNIKSLYLVPVPEGEAVFDAPSMSTVACLSAVCLRWCISNSEQMASQLKVRIREMAF